jgi:hypothetical protein
VRAQAHFALVGREERLGIWDDGLDLHDQEHPPSLMPAQDVDGSPLTEVVEGHLDRRLPTGVRDHSNHMFDKGRMGGIEEPIEAFAVPSNANVELGRKGGADGLDIRQHDPIHLATLDPGALGRREAGGRREIDLPPAPTDAQGTQGPADAKRVHGSMMGRATYVPIIATSDLDAGRSPERRLRPRPGASATLPRMEAATGR